MSTKHMPTSEYRVFFYRAGSTLPRVKVRANMYVRATSATLAVAIARTLVATGPNVEVDARRAGSRA